MKLNRQQKCLIRMTKESLTKLFGTEFFDSKDNFKAKCPFHNERTPSFYVHKEEYIAHCFGCDISGSIDQLGVQLTLLPISEVREALQITVSERIQRRLETDRATGGQKQKTSRIPESWLAPFKKEVHRYVINRGFSIQTLSEIECLYDGHTKRQVFPHRNRDGELVGAVGRACAGQDPKWKFYWNYDKGQTLYSAEPLRRESKEGKEDEDLQVRGRPGSGMGSPLSGSSSQTDLGSPYGEHGLILVEGVFDVLWLRQHGFRNAVAPIGATATKYQLSEVKEFGTDVILGFDNDQSGQEGNRRVYEAIRSDCRCWFLEWPEHANDWMDLNEDQITRIINERKSPAEFRLRGGVTRSARRDKEYAFKQKS